MDWRRGQKSKGGRWHRGTLLGMRGASICHRQPPPLAVEHSTAQQLGGSPNTLGITLQQQHLFSQEQEAGGDASFYSFHAVLHHTKSSRDRLAQRITLCHKSLTLLRRGAAAELSCSCCNASPWATADGPTQSQGAKQTLLSPIHPQPACSALPDASSGSGMATWAWQTPWPRAGGLLRVRAGMDTQLQLSAFKHVFIRSFKESEGS